MKNFGKSFASNFLILSLIILFSACSQGRKSLNAGNNQDQLSDVVLLDRVFDNGAVYPHYGEFQLQLNLDRNFAYLDVYGMADGWDASMTYRVLAKRYTGDWYILAEGLSAGPGQTLEIRAEQGQQIYQYTEWIIEFEKQEAFLDFNYLDPDARIVQETTNWPELEQELQSLGR